jgi:hypothetical protein
VDEFLRLHKPSEEAKQKAARAGLDLADLKRTDPQRYKMMVAQKVLEVSPALLPEASALFFAAFRHHELFQLEHPIFIALLVFPELSPRDLERLDNALGKLGDLPKLREQYAYFRIVSDSVGEHRQLGLPMLPRVWQGESNVLVGPFTDQLEAETWGNANVRPVNLLHDAIHQADAWFCDVFSARGV